MGYMQWNEDIAVGIENIDYQHRVIMDFINELAAAEMRHVDKSEMIRVLGRLTDYTRKHFGDEEELMERHACAEFKRHKAIHKYFLDELQDIYEGICDNVLDRELSCSDFLFHWLRFHILNADKKYVPQIAEHMIAVD